MELKQLYVFCLIVLTILTGCTKGDNKKDNEAKATSSEVIESKQATSEKELPAKEEEKPANVTTDPELSTTDEGFHYGEWKFLYTIYSYLPDDAGNVNTKVIASKVWILNDEKDFNVEAPNWIKETDAKGNRIKYISYSDGIYMGNINKYDDNNRLISITPVYEDEILENKKIILKYFGKKAGSILRRSYLNNQLVLEEIETKITDGWEYSWKEPTENNYHRVVIIQRDGKIDELVRYYASGGHTRYTFEYESNRLKRVDEIDAGDKIPYRTYEYFYREDGLLNKAHIFDPRKDSETILKHMIFSDYDENGNWQKETDEYDDGRRGIVIRKFTYTAE